jgi:hypothetical protein
LPASAKKDLERRQRRWAESAGVAVDARGYVRWENDNLRAALAPEVRAAFERGSELEPGRHRPPKLWALRSSAALVVNVFDYWRGRNAEPLLVALGRTPAPAELEFEAPFPTGLEGEPPAVDVALRLNSGGVLAIESKFSEWLTRRPRRTAVFKPKYFAAGAIWARHGLPRCEGLAADLQSGAERCRHLHAAQLLKQALGLAIAAPGRFAVHYLYYDWPGRESAVHRAELERFAARVGAELRFQASTYQELYRGLRRIDGVEPAYLEYLRARYFSTVD